MKWFAWKLNLYGSELWRDPSIVLNLLFLLGKPEPQCSDQVCSCLKERVLSPVGGGRFSYFAFPTCSASTLEWTHQYVSFEWSHPRGLCPCVDKIWWFNAKEWIKVSFYSRYFAVKNYFFVSITLRFPKCILITSCFLSLFARPLYFHQSIIILFKIIYFFIFLVYI